ncbi:MAG: putative DNA binding domain-containing protein [Synergistaceae bacterium]|jgi:ATP-dependent DNA helicase RecG|nr:putative DNA binding domain-containing protein [Synergistaceae bacterium]
MTPEGLKKLLSQGESWTVEFKECADTLSNGVFETVCSFSNRYGGHLLLGIDDSGNVLGVNRGAAQGIIRNFVNMLNNPQKISPSLYLSLEKVEIDGKLVLYVYVPVSSQVELCGGRIFDRSEDADINVTKSTDLASNLYARKSAQFTEREVFPYATLDHLRLDLLPRVKQMAVSRLPGHPWNEMHEMELFKSAGLYEEDMRTGKKGFNLAGILLFGRDEVIRSCAPGYLTDCLLRRDNLDRYDDRLTVTTNLIEAFDKIMKFIAEHTMDRFFLIGEQNISVRSWIAREMVSNTLMHREYSSSLMSRVIIEKDRIVTENANRSQILGKLDPANFTARSKNPIIARFFVNIGRADELGSGVRNLYRYTRLYSDGAEPELIEGDVFRTIIPLIANVPLNNSLGNSPDVPVNRANVPVNVPVNRVNVPVNVPVNKPDVTAIGTVALVLSLIAAEPGVSLDVIAEKIGRTRKTVQRVVKKLRENGSVRRVGPDKTGHWEVVDVADNSESRREE